MKNYIKLFVVSIALISLSSMINQAKKRVVFFGDSITEAGIKPGGYITRLNSMLDSQRLASQFELTGAGISGNKVYDLYLRMEDDVLSKDPDVVVIWVGVNDVWHKASSGTGTDADKFEKFYKAIIKKLQAKNIRVVLVTPACIGERTDYTNQQDGDLNLYSEIIRKLATDNNCTLVDLRKDFLEYNKKNNTGNKRSGILTTDGVHLSDKGNQFVAEKMMKVLVSPSKGAN